MGYIPKPDNIPKEVWATYWKEWDRCFKINYEAEQQFITDRGYKHTTVPHHLRGTHPAYDDCNEYRTGPFISPNGQSYETYEEFYEKTGQNPMLEKDGICYGLYEVLRKENWKNAEKRKSRICRRVRTYN